MYIKKYSQYERSKLFGDFEAQSLMVLHVLLLYPGIG